MFPSSQSNPSHEEIFFNRPLALGSDADHSQTEARFYALGQTDRARLLSLSFTIRNRLIRPTSAREMNAHEAMIAELKLLANKRDVPYQSLLKVFLAERVREELMGAKQSD